MRVAIQPQDHVRLRLNQSRLGVIAVLRRSVRGRGLTLARGLGSSRRYRRKPIKLSLCSCTTERSELLAKACQTFVISRQSSVAGLVTNLDRVALVLGLVRLVGRPGRSISALRAGFAALPWPRPCDESSGPLSLPSRLKRLSAGRPRNTVTSERKMLASALIAELIIGGFGLSAVQRIAAEPQLSISEMALNV